MMNGSVLAILLLTVFVIVVPNLANKSNEFVSLEHYNFLVGIAKIGTELHGNDTKCGQELEILLTAIAQQQFWSLKVLDSFGAAPKSFGWGNYFWLGTPALCAELNAPYSITFSPQHQLANDFNVKSPVPLSYTVIYMNFSTPHYIDMRLPFESLINLGLCLPASCDQHTLMHYADIYFQRDNFVIQRNFALQLWSLESKTPTFEWKIFKCTSSVIFIVLCILLIMLMILAELLHKSKQRLQQQQQLHTKPTGNLTKTTIPKPETSTTSSTPSCAESLILCFRLSANFKLAVRADGAASKQRFLTAIAGLRGIICLWVTVFHVYYYALFAMSNVPLIFAKLEQFALQPIMQACFYVDVFFVNSAFLLVYNFLANAPQMQQIRRNSLTENMKLWLKAVAQRYLRLTPVLIVTMLMSDIVHNLLNMYTPFRLGRHSGIYCKQNWWYNLLYLQNFLDMDNICCSWTWYLGCEMQYFLLFTALLYVYAKNAKIAKILYTALALGFVAIAWLCNYKNGITFQIDIIYSTLNELYVKPWVRIVPYIGGAVGGWLLHQYTHTQTPVQVTAAQVPVSVPRHQQLSLLLLPAAVSWRATFWFIVASIYVATNFMSYWRTTSTVIVATIMSLGKLLFALTVDAVIVLCACGQGGWLNALLSARIFRQLNKFCYSIYMLAPVMVFASFGLRNESTNFTEVGSANDFFGITVLSLVVGFLLVLLVELPMQRISSILFKKIAK